jgi:rhodanese-related sulfurtransferase
VRALHQLRRRLPASPVALGPARAAGLVEEGAPLLLDVRETSERQAGHAPEPARSLSPSYRPSFKLEAGDRLIVAVCRSGGRSARATALLGRHGCRGGQPGRRLPGPGRGCP